MDTEQLAAPSRLGPALAAQTGDERWLEVSARLIAGGKSNLTFELTSAAGTLILRRPPSGHLLPSAHDMVREARVQRALAGTAVPVPEIVLVDAEGELLGVPCYVMARVAGHVIRDRLPDGYAVTPAERQSLADALVDGLAALHAIDPAAVGLAGFGRPEGYLARQIRRWGQQWDKSATHQVPELTRLGELLAAGLPPDSRPAIVHGDYRLDNCIMDARDPAVIAAVLDWEMSTLGDPLTDLGMLLFYWAEPGDQARPSLVPTVTAQPGFPPRARLAERYASRTGVSLAEIDYYLAFANYKFAVIAQGIAARVAAGAMAGQDFGDLDPLVLGCARAGLDILAART
jgi:aminoglycoside phosphotransferase (APT) family kinase protein